MGASKVVYKLRTQKITYPKWGIRQRGLQLLLQLGKQVPETYVVTAQAWRRNQQG